MPNARQALSWLARAGDTWPGQGRASLSMREPYHFDTQFGMEFP
jgi:hypothetical protein